MSLAQKLENKISEEDYLAGELISDTKHEYVDGDVFAMAGASKKHNLISRNFSFEFEKGLRNNNSPCSTFSSDMKVRLNHVTTSYFYPDVMVVCDSDEKDDYFQNSPVIIVEVLSKATSKYDKSNKRLAYFNLPSLKEYVLVEQENCEVVVFEKEKGWQSSYYFLGDEIVFKSIGIRISVEDIYYQIKNEETIAYALEKTNEQDIEVKMDKE